MQESPSFGGFDNRWMCFASVVQSFLTQEIWLHFLFSLAFCSSVDKAHLRLAAAKAMLRLSKHWDHKIPVDIFYLTLGTSEVNFLPATTSNR